MECQKAASAAQLPRYGQMTASAVQYPGQTAASAAQMLFGQTAASAAQIPLNCSQTAASAAQMLLGQWCYPSA